MAVFLNVRWKHKCSLIIKEISYQPFESKDQALAWAYNYHDCSYLKSIKTKHETAYIVWQGNPSYGYSDYRHVIIVPAQNNFTISHNDNNLKLRLVEMLFDWSKDREQKLYIDRSTMLSRLAWSTSIPKGWKLLRTGSVIKETDKQFGSSAYGKNFWGIVHGYNVGKKVGRMSGINYIKLVNGKEMVYRKEPGHPDPLIIRKVN